MNFEPMLGMFGFGGGEILLLLVVVLCMLLVPVGAVLIVYFIVGLAKTKPQPTPLAPVPAAPVSPVAPVAAQAPLVATQTVVMPRKCPQCGAVLQPDTPEGLCPACLLQRGFATEGAAPSGQPAFVPPAIDELAKLFPQLEILECLGRGGMGAVYKARQPRLERFVALKILAPEKQSDPQFAERFEREARVLARLSHPNIVSIFDFGEVQGRFYLLMEYVDGLTLRQVMQAGKISPAEALDLVPKICEALQYAHGQGIVHRDIKPENILLDKQGHLKIADFGIAKIAGVESKGLSLTGARDVMGTPVYMAPEQVEKPQTVDHRADIYSLGVVFYEMLTGELPLGKFAAPSQKVQMDVRLDEVVLHALEKEPARRYQQASQVKTAVETIAGSPPPFAPAPAAVQSMLNPTLITAPAVALMVAGLWKILSALLNGLVLLPGGLGWLDKLVGGSFFSGWGSVAVVSLVLFKFIPGVLILFGGYQMLQRQSYSWATGAGILSIVACSLVSLPIGIWALVVLARDDVKAAFAGVGFVAAAPGRPDHFWRRFILVVTCVILIPIVLVFTGLAVAAFSVPHFFQGQEEPKKLTALELQQAGIRQENGEFRKDLNQSFPLDANGRFSIDNVNGRIEIHGWSSNAVALTAAIHGKSGERVKAVEINIDSQPGQATVHTETPSGINHFQWNWNWFKNLWRGEASVDYTVSVPQNAQLANVSGVNGRIEIDGVAGDITAATVNGATQIRNAAHDLKLSTVNGQIKASMDRLGDGQSVSLDAVNGQLELAVPEDADANFSVSTVNGSINSDFAALKPEKEFPVGNKLNGSLGRGSASVKVTAVNGAVKFLKAQAASQTARNQVPSISPAPTQLAEAVETNPPTATNSSAMSADDQAAVAAAQAWLKLIDSGDYAESWKQASAIVQGAAPQPDFAKAMEMFRQPLGEVVSRHLTSAQDTAQSPGAADGQYVLMQFETSFANKKSAVETVTFGLGKDGQWRSAGYFIK